jgi:hypothetical protein
MLRALNRKSRFQRTRLDLEALETRDLLSAGLLPGYYSMEARQATALDGLHAETELTVVPNNLVDRHNVGMIEVGSRLRLGAEALDLGTGG